MRRMWMMAVLGATMATGAGAAAEDVLLTGITWVIESVKGVDAPIDTAKTSLQIAADGKVATTIGCNRMGGTATIAGEKMTFGPMMATRMACPPPLMEQEQLYSAALEATRSYAIKDGKLSLRDDSGAEVARFARDADPNPQ